VRLAEMGLCASLETETKSRDYITGTRKRGSYTQIFSITIHHNKSDDSNGTLSCDPCLRV